jgi:hypothetical protein
LRRPPGLAEEAGELGITRAAGILDAGLQAQRVAEACPGEPDEVVVLAPRGRPVSSAAVVGVLVVVAGMLGVPVPVVEVIHMIIVLDSLVAAALAVDVLVPGLLVLPVLRSRHL